MKSKKKKKSSKENGSTSNATTSHDVDKLRESLDMTVRVVGSTGQEEENVADVRPLDSFDESGVDAGLLAVACKDYKKPTPIQAQCIPYLLTGVDMIGVAATGSGKTMAYVLPGLMHVCGRTGATGGKRGSSSKGTKSNTMPRCLVLAPTRELAQQINDEVNRCTPGTQGMAGPSGAVKSIVVYGGVAKVPQARALRAGDVGVVVATPGRLIDLVNDGVVSLSGVDYLVLDEADRMLDLGFEVDIRNIVKQTSANRQTIMFSATWPESVERLAAEFLSGDSHVRVTIGSTALAASHSVKQIVEVLKPEERDRRLLSLLRDYHKKGNRILIFVLYKKEAPRVESLLSRNGHRCIGISGDKSQADRNRAVEQFKSGETPLLIATDVAARGLDIEGVEYVINYSFPLTSEDYVHRIGRTGRAGNTGVAHTFFTVNDKARSGELVNVLREAGQDVPEELMKFGTTVKKKEHALYGAHFKDGAPMAKATKITFD